MSSILDQIIENTPVASFPSVRPFGATNGTQYMRGIARPVTDDSTLNSVLEQTGLNWRTVALPVLAQGRHENRVVPGRKVLVRSDNGEPIEVVSSTFKEHQNAEIVAPIIDFIRTIGGRVKAGGYLAGSGRVFLVASLGQRVNTARDRQVEDITELEVFISGGHVPGTPRTVRAVGRRLVCSNGMSIPFADVIGVGRVTHRQSIPGSAAESGVRTWLENATRGFERLTEAMAAFQSTPASRALQSALIIEATSGADILNQIIGVPAHTREGMLEAIIRRDEQERQNRADVDWLLNGGTTESLSLPRRIINTIDTQPGASITRGTLAHAVNGVSNYVDNLRGRTPSSAVESALMGDGERLKNTTLTIAGEWLEAAVSVGVAR